MNINTNLSSLITQSSLKTSTLKLNQAIERMTTGCKINHAKDNAANYSISNNFSTKIGAYQVAEDNAMMGLDLINTASGALEQMSDRLARVRALQEQAMNNTYGSRSIDAIQSEVDAIVDEVQRLYDTAEYNGVKLFMGTDKAECTADLMIKITPRDVSSMESVESLDENVKITSGSYSVSTAEELQKISTMTKKNLVGEDVEFVLANDIGLSAYSSGTGWEPVSLGCTFDGNGHKISNLYINDSTITGALFIKYNNRPKISNLGVEDAHVTAMYASGLVDSAESLYNCYITGEVKAVGNNINVNVGLMARAVHSASYCYSKGAVSYKGNVAGLFGDVLEEMRNCYSISDVTCTGSRRSSGGAGGLVSDLSSAAVSDCFFSGNVDGGISSCVGGLIRASYGPSSITNCYFAGSLTKGYNFTGTLVGFSSDTTLTNCCSLTKNTSITELITDYGGNTLNECYNKAYDGTVPFTAEDLVPEGAEPEKDYTSLDFQVGINSGKNSTMSCSIAFSMSELNMLRKITEEGNLERIDKMISKVSAKQTEFGAAQNRLESALEEISIQYENLVSSRSTLQDADIAEVSSEYIRQQILQQASATLMATANQAPAIALQLL